MVYQILSAKILGSCPEGVVNWVFQEDNLGMRKDADLLAASLEVNRLHFFCKGSGTVFIKRNNQIGKILENSGEVGGPIKEGDFYLLCSERFLELVSLIETQKALINDDLQTIAENLTAVLYRHENTDGAACLVLKIRKTDSVIARSETTKQSLYRGVEIATVAFGSLAMTGRKIFNLIKRKPRILVTFALLLLLVFSIVRTLITGANDHRLKTFNSVLSSASDQYQQGKELINLNNARASQLLTEAQDDLQKIQKTFDEKSHQAQQIANLLKQINQALDQANQIYKVVPQLFFDLSLVKPGAVGSKLRLSSDLLYIFDKKNFLIYQLNLKTKASKILAGGDGVEKKWQEIKLKDENSKTYTLDKINKKVMVEEEGTLVSQYKWESGQNFTELVASEELKLILLLEGNKIYSIFLK